LNKKEEIGEREKRGMNNKYLLHHEPSSANRWPRVLGMAGRGQAGLGRDRQTVGLRQAGDRRA
jgi:hypothetical protein